MIHLVREEPSLQFFFLEQLFEKNDINIQRKFDIYTQNINNITKLEYI